ncbi:MAG TPA: UvrD-helicase domain-containing protein [Gemmatimonadaceae bacterium]
MTPLLDPPTPLSDSAIPDLAGASLRIPSSSQRAAIEAGVEPLLVLAGPGAGKTFCLIERIRFLLERHGIAPDRICAFTFTNKAAGEIAERLGRTLGDRASQVKTGTIHAFCAELLRELGARIGVEPGFGIADDEYQLNTLRRIEGPRRWHRNTLTRFSAHRFRRDPLFHDDLALFQQYERFLDARRLIDFDTLVLKAAEALEQPEAGASVRSRWQVILVDEFQDLNPVQYRVIRALARDHRHVFAVGDDEQSIYSWAGADPSVFGSYVNDFKIGPTTTIHLEENRRCPRDVFSLARRLVALNTPIFDHRITPRADHDSAAAPVALGFETEADEMSWIIEDIRRDRANNGHAWGDVALLYRKHETGEGLEAAFLNAGLPCRLAQGRALSEDPVVAYVLAALRVIANPTDDVYRDAFFGVVLPRALFDEARAQAESSRHDLRRQLNHMATRLPRAHESGRQVRRALTDWRNLVAVGKRHATLAALVQELLSRRVGSVRSVLDDRHDEISDPASLPDVVQLASRLRAARDTGAEIWMPRMGGIEIGLKGILGAIGLTNVRLGGAHALDSVRIGRDDVPSVGIALGVFKAAQLVEMTDAAAAFTSFTAIDLETTDRNTADADIVEIAAVRVRDGRIAETFASLVKPRRPIASGATDTHGIRAIDVAAAPRFEDVWPKIRAFCGDDVIVAHNGYEFDFRILGRLVRATGKRFDLCTYDTLPLARDLYPTSRKLPDLARNFGIPTGRSHRALDDTLTLAKVVLALDEVKRSRARKTALVSALDQLGIALALSDEDRLGTEARMFRYVTRAFALGRYSSCLEIYEREQGEDISIPSADEVIDRLGGAELMLRIRADRSADERYPAAMIRLRRLIADLPDGPLASQIGLFLERAMLSRWEGHEPDHARVNLLTLHSTKGLEFSRVYVVGVEDAQLPGGAVPAGPKPEEVEEARRLLYVGMTRTKERLVLTRTATRKGKPTRGHQFLDEMGLPPQPPT